MSVESKNHRPSPVRSVAVSEGTRRDARAATHEPRSAEERHGELVTEKLQIQRQLGEEFGDTAFLKAQQKVRDKFGDGGSLREWIRVKEELEKGRRRLVARMQAIEVELIDIKPRVREERKQAIAANRSTKNRIDYGECALAIIRELKAMRSEIESLRSALSPSSPAGEGGAEG